tara:strand:+ start:564 stop:2447 length:1884 start_codon:yes stop_codon:yes gene_type:complete
MATKDVNLNIIAKDKSKQALQKVQSNLDVVKKSAFNLKNALIGVGTALAVRSILQTTAEFEDLRDSLDSVTGSAKSGGQAFGFISDFATRSQFSIQDLTRSFITLKASGIEPTERLFRTFTDTASVTTDQIGTLEALTRVFSRGVQGGLGLEELNQIADRGVPVFKILEKEIGKTRLELSEFGKTTDGASIILNALQKGLSETFAGATEKKLDNLSVSFSNLGIALDNVQNAFGQEVSPELVIFTDHISNLLKFLEPLAKGLGKVANFLIGSVNRAFEMIGHAVNFVIDTFEDFAFTVGIIDQKTQRAVKSQTDLRIAINATGKTIDQVGKLDKITKQIEKNNTLIENIKKTQMTELQLIEDKNKKELELVAKQKDLLREQVELKLLDGAEFHQLELAMLQNNIKELTNLEMEIRKQGAKEKLDLAKKTAKEEKEIMQKLMNDNFEAIKTGNAHQIELEKLTATQQKDLAVKTGRELVSQLAQSNKTAFQIDKALSMATAIMNTAQGVTKALSVGNIPLAFIIGALGAVQVATIAKTKYQGRRLGGRMNQGEPYMVGEAGAELVVPDRPSNVVPNSKLGNMSQPVTVNFNISTVDARGFNELLVNSRGTIVNLINSAVNEKGKMAII